LLVFYKKTLFRESTPLATQFTVTVNEVDIVLTFFKELKRKKLLLGVKKSVKGRA